MSFLIIDMKVNGESVTANIPNELDIYDVSGDMDKVASQIAYWGNVWAEADKEEITAKAYYRNWKADVGDKISSENEKLAEWKVRQKIEALPEFRAIKEKLAEAARNVTSAKTMCEAFKAKASMLQSKGAMMRAELDSTSMKTREREAAEKRVVNKKKLKEILNKGK